MTDPAIEIAEIIQTASIKKSPSAAHDLNPSTAASRKAPLTTIGSSSSEDEAPSGLRPLPRKRTLPPLPDVRFEQSYLASISRAETKWQIAWITVRDQVCDINYNLIAAVEDEINVK